MCGHHSSVLPSQGPPRAADPDGRVSAAPDGTHETIPRKGEYYLQSDSTATLIFSQSIEAG